MLQLIPYCEVDGIRTFSDSDILEIYSRMEMNGTVDRTFVDNQIVTAQDFLRVMKYGENKLYIVMDDGEEIAITWLNRFEGKTARLHFCFINLKYKGKIGMGRFVVNEFLNWKNNENEYLFDVLIGVVPTANEIGCMYVKEVGFIEIGMIPFGSYNRFTGQSETAMVGYLDRGGLR